MVDLETEVNQETYSNEAFIVYNKSVMLKCMFFVSNDPLFSK
jgi:hypothetical protein